MNSSLAENGQATGRIAAQITRSPIERSRLPASAGFSYKDGANETILACGPANSVDRFIDADERHSKLSPGLQIIGLDRLSVAAMENDVFVIELPGETSKKLSFASEAPHEVEAAELVGTSRFKEAIREYLRAKSDRAGIADFTPQIRPATHDEISAYRDFAEEFAEMTGCLLLAPVS